MPSVQIEIEVPRTIVVSLVHIGVQSLRVIASNRAETATDVCELEAELPELSVRPVTVAVPPLLPGSRHEVLVPFSLGQLDRANLLMMLNRQDGLACSVRVRSRDGVVAEQAVKVLPPNAWLYEGPAEALAAFVDKESEAVQRIKLAARPYLRQQLGVGSFIDAIQKSVRELKVRDELGRMKRIVSSIYDCLLHSHNIHYEAEPRTYPEDWQKIRLHDQVLSERQGTCIDLALLAAACLEDAFLNPVLILFKTGGSSVHAIVGCWKTESMARSPVITDFAIIEGWLGGSDPARMSLLTCDVTGFSAGVGWPVSLACEEAVARLRRAGRKDFVWAVDIARCREKGISPLPFGQAPVMSAEGWRVVREAEALARHYRYDVVERAHVLLALIQTSETVTHDVFGQEATRRMHQVIERELTEASPDKQDVRLLQWTRSAHRLRDRAARLADEHGTGLVGAMQLWHALIEDPGGRAGRVLAKAHPHPKDLISKLIQLAEADPQRVSYLTGGSEP